MIKFKNLGNVDSRSGFGEGLLELGKENKNIVALCADLTGSLKMNAFKENFQKDLYKLELLKQI